MGKGKITPILLPRVCLVYSSFVNEFRIKTHVVLVIFFVCSFLCVLCSAFNKRNFHSYNSCAKSIRFAVGPKLSMACVFLMSFGCIVSISTAKLCDALFLFGKLEIAEKSQRQSELRLRPGKCYSHLDVNMYHSESNCRHMAYKFPINCLQCTTGMLANITADSQTMCVCVYVVLK